MSGVRLCILFNHAYEQNIPKLRALYRDRFSDIVFLSPFYRGQDEDVIAYYERSHLFHAALPQGLDRLTAGGADHFVFVADDLILHPSLNEHTVLDRLGGRERIALPALTNLSALDGPLNARNPFLFGPRWPRRMEIFYLDGNAFGCEWRAHLPDRDWMVQRIRGIGLDPAVNLTEFRAELTAIGNKLEGIDPIMLDPVYPCIAGYTDLFVVPRPLLADFAHYLGVLAAMNLFVEIAIPTAALMVSAQLDRFDVIHSEVADPVVPAAQAGAGLVFWEGGIPALEAELGLSLAKLFTGPRSESLFIHPVKLSRWVA